MNILKHLAPLMLLILLGACASSMQPQNYSSRIDVSWQTSNHFTVSYRDDPAATTASIVDLTLLRSAEAALQNGFHYFAVVSLDNENERVKDGLQTQVANQLPDEGQRYRQASPAATNRIICYRSNPPGFAYVALFVKASLRSKYGLDQVSGAI